MSKRSCISSTYLAIFISITLQAQNIRDHGQLGQIPLYFEENHGQAEAAVAFVARSSNLLAFVTHGGLVISSAGARISMRIAGADTHQQLHREGEVNGITNYYLGSKNVVGLTHYSAIRAEQVRPGIDVVYHGNGTDLEYDFLVHPRGSTANLRVLYDGAKHVAVSEAGEVILSTGTSEVHQKKPQAWQVVAGRRENVECHYVLSGRNEVRLVVGSYRRSSELIIDPILSYSTFLGGSKPDLADAVAVDFNGNAYVTGWTQSSDFPVTSGKLRGTRDVFVTELNSSGTALIYSTYIGGSTDQLPFGIALDGGGNAFITGETTSNNFPFTRGHYSAGQDAFVVELGPSGAITYATALGGSNDDAGAGIAVDSSGAAYVAGSTSSKDFPVTSHAFMTKLLGQGNAFVAKLTPSGAISYATFLGGKHFDGAGPIAVDSFGNAYVGGSTNSLDFPVTAGAFSTTNHGENDAFVTELNPDGTELKFSTLLGGSYSDGIGGIAVDSTGCYVTGFTFSGDFPTTPGAFATVKPSQPASYSSGFVTKLDPSGASLLYSTFLGGNNDDTANAIAIDSGSAYVAGEAWSANFPTTAGALRSRLPGITYSENDMFLSQISPDGSSLSYSTLFGATAYGASSLALAMAVDGKGGVYLVGPSLFSAGDRYEYLFPTTPGSFQEERPQSSTPAEESAAIVKIDFSSPTLCTPSISPQSQNLPSYGGSFSFNLTLAPGCPWEAIPDQVLSPNAPYFNVDAPYFGLGASSPIQVTGTVGQNNSLLAGATSAVRVGSATFTVNQSPGSCSDPLISPASVTFDSSGGNVSLSLTLPSQCAWTAVSTVPWLRVTANSSGIGPATVTIVADQNSYSQRSVQLILAGASIMVTQAGLNCTATAVGTPLSYAGSGGTGIATISTGSECTWTAYSTVPWIQLSAPSASGQGSGGAPFVVAGNPGLFARTGSIQIADQMLTISQAAGPAGSITGFTPSIFAGTTALSTSSSGDGGPALQAQLSYVQGLAWDSATGTLLLVDRPNTGVLVRAITPDGIINTIAGGGSGMGENIAATSANLGYAFFVGVDPSSAVYVIDMPSRVRKIAQGEISTFAGGMVTGFSGDGSAATAALLDYPQGIISDSAGNIYIADQANHRVREVTAGTIQTLVGGGTQGLGDGGPATSATLAAPYGMAFDSAGDLYIADAGNNLVRKVSHGVITTFAGGGSGGDGGPAIKAILYAPTGVAVDLLGDVFILEGDYDRIRMVTPNGTISTISPYGALANALAIDTAGNLYYSDNGAGHTVRKMTPVSGYCNYSVAIPGTLAATGGTFSIAVTTAPSCNWTSFSDSPWITVSSGASGTGNGTVVYNVTSNLNSAGRSDSLAIAGQAVSINQAGLTPPTLSITSQHAANFYQGEQGAQYTLTVSNSTNALPTSGVVVVTENVPSGLILVSMAGSGWNCPGTASNNCTRSDPLSAGTSYPSILATVNVAANASSPKISAATVSGGGAVSANVSDSTVVTIPAPAPSVSAVLPKSETAGKGPFVLKISGKNFEPNSVVLWAGSSRPTTFVSHTQLKAEITGQDIPAAATIAVSVMTPAPGGGTSGIISFAVNNPRPVLNSFSPASVTTGSGNLTLTLNGANFINGSVVEWNGSNRTPTFLSAAQLQVELTSADVTSAGKALVKVVNPIPGGGTSVVRKLAINNPVPVVASVSPSSIEVDAPAFPLTVIGNNFVNGSTVVWKTARLATTFVDSSHLSASVLANDVFATGTESITVVNPMPGGGSSNKVAFTVDNPIPTAASLTPSSAMAGGPAFSLTVQGSHFTAASSVLWNGLPLATTFISSTMLRAKVPASDINATGSAQVIVSNPAPGGGQSDAISFALQ